MTITVNVTQDDIDHGDHSSCHWCMLGRAIQRHLKPEYWLKIETVASLSNHKFGREKMGNPAKENTHVSVSILKYGFIKEKAVLYREELPEIAIKSANNWEHAANPKEYPYHEDFTLKPFTFELNIPKEYLKDE